MNSEQRRDHGKQRFHVLELLCTAYLCPVLRTILIRKTALKSPIFLRQIFLLTVIRVYLFDRQHVFLPLFKPVVTAWPRQTWMGALGGGTSTLLAAGYLQAPPGSLATTESQQPPSLC